MSTWPSAGCGTGRSTSSRTSGPPNSVCWIARIARHPKGWMPRVLSRVARRMSVTVVGSIAYDAVKTPFGERERMLGGAATHFALAASFFDEVRVVGPVGGDFGEDDFAVLRTRGTITDDVDVVPDGKTFFWAGEYGWARHSREKLDTQLNVFEQFAPTLSEPAPDCDVLFLANIQPTLQLDVLDQ